MFGLKCPSPANLEYQKHAQTSWWSMLRSRSESVSSKQPPHCNLSVCATGEITRPPHLVISGGTSSLQMALEMGNLSYIAPISERYFTIEFCNPLYYWCFWGGSTLAGPLQDLVSQVQGLADVRRDRDRCYMHRGYKLQSKQNTAQYVCFETTFVSSLRGPIFTKKTQVGGLF